MRIELFDNETDPGQIVEPGGEPAAPEVDAAEPVEPAAPEPAAVPQAPEIDWSDLNVLNQAAAALQAQGFALAPIQPEPQAQPELPEYDPYDPDSLKAHVVSPLEQRLAAMEQALQAQQHQQVQDFISNEVGRAVEESGVDGLDAGAVRSMAAYIAASDPQVARLGPTVEGIRAANQKAIEFFRDREKAAEQRGIENYLNGLTKDGSNLLDPGVRNTIALEGQPEPRSEADVARLFNQRRSAQPV